MNEKRLSQAERSEQREEALRKQEQAIHESRVAARHRKPEETAPDELLEKSRRQRQIILKVFLLFLVAGIIYAVYDALRSGSSGQKRRPPVTQPTEPVEY